MNTWRKGEHQDEGQAEWPWKKGEVELVAGQPLMVRPELVGGGVVATS